jgi:DnaJ-class molecular chaperone
MEKMNGRHITCFSCDGVGIVSSWGSPDECKECGGSGRIWEYPSGTLARYYSGPLCGRKEAHHVVAK